MKWINNSSSAVIKNVTTELHEILIFLNKTPITNNIIDRITKRVKEIDLILFDDMCSSRIELLLSECKRINETIIEKYNECVLLIDAISHSALRPNGLGSGLIQHGNNDPNFYSFFQGSICNKLTIDRRDELVDSLFSMYSACPDLCGPIICDDELEKSKKITFFVLSYFLPQIFYKAKSNHMCNEIVILKNSAPPLMVVGGYKKPSIIFINDRLKELKDIVFFVAHEYAHAIHYGFSMNKNELSCFEPPIWLKEIIAFTMEYVFYYGCLTLSNNGWHIGFDIDVLKDERINRDCKLRSNLHYEQWRTIGETLALMVMNKLAPEEFIIDLMDGGSMVTHEELVSFF
jgi:hypothetical protein